MTKIVKYENKKGDGFHKHLPKYRSLYSPSLSRNKYMSTCCHTCAFKSFADIPQVPVIMSATIVGTHKHQFDFLNNLFNEYISSVKNNYSTRQKALKGIRDNMLRSSKGREIIQAQGHMDKHTFQEKLAGKDNTIHTKGKGK